MSCKLVRHFHVLLVHALHIALHIGPSISCPAISCPAILMVHHFYVQHFQSTIDVQYGIISASASCFNGSQEYFSFVVKQSPK